MLSCEGRSPVSLGGQFRIEAFVKPGFVYMMANHVNGTIYTGVTSTLVQRAWEHREVVSQGFSRQYGCKLLVV